METGLSIKKVRKNLEKDMETENKEDILMVEMKKYWKRGVRFYCGERVLDEFSAAEALAEDGRYMVELDINMLGEVMEVNFQDIGL
jgi:hypothetical protein